MGHAPIPRERHYNFFVLFHMYGTTDLKSIKVVTGYCKGFFIFGVVCAKNDAQAEIGAGTVGFSQPAVETPFEIVVAVFVDASGFSSLSPKTLCGCCVSAGR